MCPIIFTYITKKLCHGDNEETFQPVDNCLMLTWYRRIVNFCRRKLILMHTYMCISAL